MTDFPEWSANALLGSRGDTRRSRVTEGTTAWTVLRLVLALDALILLVAVGHLSIGAPYQTVEALFSLDNEPTIPGWYASVKLLLVACLLAALSVSMAATPGQRRALLGAALLFLLMSCDEAAAIHERVQRMIDNQFLTDGEVLAKVILGLTALAIAAFAVTIVVRTLQRIAKGKTAFWAGFLLLGIGAVGVDLTQELLSLGPAGTALSVILEESFEMIGVTLMIYGALQALACAPVTLHLGARLTVGNPLQRPYR